jgi:cysteine-rich repeat protein
LKVAASLLAIASVVALTEACILDESAAKDDPLCVPGAYVFCRCADRAQGTKLCKADGNSFEACTTGSSGACSGGEIADPRTNQPVEVPKQDPAGIGTTLAPDAPNALDACPGKPTAVLPNIEEQLEGDTTAATTDRAARPGACLVGQGAKDQVYALVPTGSGSLRMTIRAAAPSALVPLAYIRTSCEDAAAQAACAPPLPDKTASLELNVQTGKPYFLFVDGASGTTGKYTVTMKLSTHSFCGDGNVDTNEACDDGNKVENDGCSNDCQHPNGNPATGGGGAGDPCSGHPVDLWPGRTVTGTGSTNTYASTWSAPGRSCVSGTNDDPDHVYAVTPHAGGTLVVSLSKNGQLPLDDHMLVARRSCNDASSTEAGMCANDLGVGGAETISFPVTNGDAVFVAVDGGGDTSNNGDYTITFKLQ